MTNTHATTVDVLIIGAGQAGLVTGYFLKDTGLSFHLYDHYPHIGDAWRQRYDSLRLFSPRATMRFPACMTIHSPYVLSQVSS